MSRVPILLSDLVVVPAASLSEQPSTTEVAIYISAADGLATSRPLPKGASAISRFVTSTRVTATWGVGVVQRPPKAAGTRLDAIQHLTCCSR